MEVSRSSKRYVAFPPDQDQIEYWDLYLDQLNLHWSFGEFDFEKDKEDYNKLSPELMKIFDTILAYFAFTDGIVTENCVDIFMKTSRSIECKIAYIQQAEIEVIHMITYGMAIKNYIQDEKKRYRILNSHDDDENVQAKTEWTKKYMDTSIPENERLVAFACAEGIFFISAFAFIFYLKSKNLMPIFGSVNQSISKDEQKHAELSILRYNKDYKDDRLSQEKVHEIIRSAVELEHDFIDRILPHRIDDLFPEEIKGYVEVLADNISYFLGYKKIYNRSMKIIPSWLSIISLEPKHNFYEVLPQNYRQFSKSDMKEKQEKKKINLDEVDF
jgi:ribonucleotide reductase beta subunit family protein with ferritin-like domain